MHTLTGTDALGRVVLYDIIHTVIVAFLKAISRYLAAMSTLCPGSVSHESIVPYDARGKNLCSRPTHRFPNIAFPKHVMWLHPTEQLKHVPLTSELNSFVEYVQVSLFSYS